VRSMPRQRSHQQGRRAVDHLKSLTAASVASEQRHVRELRQLHLARIGPVGWLTVRGELFQKNHLTKATDIARTSAQLCPREPIHGHQAHEHCQGTDTVSATTRYIYQKGKMSVTGFLRVMKSTTRGYYQSHHWRDHRLESSASSTPRAISIWSTM